MISVIRDRARGLLFDLDGTLVDSAPAIANALSTLRAERGAIRPADLTLVRQWVSLGASTLVTRGLGEVAGDAEGDVAAFRSVLRSQPPCEVVFPGVVDALEAAAVAGLPMAVVTNKPHALSVALLNQLGLSQFMRDVVGGDSAEACKPHPAPMWAGLAAVGCAAAETIYVGDSAVDALAAEAVGAPFLVFEGGYAPAECPAELVSGRFSEFCEFAAAVRSRPDFSGIEVPVNDRVPL